MKIKYYFQNEKKPKNLYQKNLIKIFILFNLLEYQKNMVYLRKMMKFIILFPFKHTNIVLFHLLLNFIFACIIYSKLKPYYDPELNKIHIKYPEFRRLDKLSFIRLWIGLSTVFWPRALFFLFLLAFMAFTLNIGKISKYKCIKDLIFSYGCRFVLVSLGCIIPHKIRYDNKSKEIYKKYLN